MPDKTPKRYFELLEKILEYHPEADTELIKKAYIVATEAHVNQKRANQEPYIVHPLNVAMILATMGLDEIAIASGLLHDVVEDTFYTEEDLRKKFGDEIAKIVAGVTKIGKMPHYTNYDKDQAKAESTKKMIVAMAEDIRVILVKLADRLHNMRTLSHLREEKQKRIALETLDIYAPIAHRLGIGQIKEELEDLSFAAAYRAESQELHNFIEENRELNEKSLMRMKGEILALMKQSNIKGVVSYRIKRPISIFRKMIRQKIDVKRVYDLLALRVIVEDVESCYLLHSEINRKWHFMQFRLRDFIKRPKENGYSSLHTTIIYDSRYYEIQIRTQDMDNVAEMGIAAHWRYKEGIAAPEDEKKIEWFRSIIKNYKNHSSAQDFVQNLKSDLKSSEIYVYTPMGKVITLPVGSTPIDFAYAIHSKVGECCKGAFINEHHASIKTVLKSGDMVEIETDKRSAPKQEWLNHVASNRARRRINYYLSKQENIRYIERGKRIWKKHYREIIRKYKDKVENKSLEERVGFLKYNDLDSFYKDLGNYSKSLDKEALQTLFPELKIMEVKRVLKVQEKGKKNNLYRLIEVEGLSDVDISLAKCCHPIKGEKIYAYVTLNRGIAIHNADCHSIKKMDMSRLKNARWKEDIGNYTYMVQYEVTLPDKPGNLNRITNILSELNINIRDIRVEKKSKSTSTVYFTIEVSDSSQLQNIDKELNKFEGIKNSKHRRV